MEDMQNVENSDSDEEPEFIQYKVVVVGDGTVGKTSLCKRLCDSEFEPKYKQTIGLDFFVKRIELPGNVNIALQIWDIGGQNINGNALSTYIFGSNAVVLIYDITNYDSFVNLQEWLSVVNRSIGGTEKPYIALVGNKTDLFHMQAVKLDKHNAFSESNELHSYFLSAKTGDQVYNTFLKIAADLAGVKLTKTQIETSQTPVKAEILNYSNDVRPGVAAAQPSAPNPQVAAPPPVAQAVAQPPPSPQKKKSKCVIF